MRKGFFGNIRLLLLTILTIAGIYFLPVHTAFAATGTQVEIASVEYYEEQIILLNNGNTKIYFASETDAAKDNWEVINADPGLFTMVDFSWMSPTVENILVFKGNKDSAQTRVIIGERPMKLDVSISYSNIDKMDPDDSIAPLVNIMTSVGNGLYPVTFDDLEWRKGETGQWATTRTLTVGLLEKYLVKGTYLNFRIRALDDVVDSNVSGTPIDFNEERILGVPGGIREYEGTTGFHMATTGYPNGTNGRRFSNEVKVKIAKKSSPMVYGIDGEEFTAEIKYGKEYRLTVGSATSGWVQVTDRAVKSIPLATIYKNTINPAATINGTTIPFPSMKIEIRDYSTDKAASSKITEISLNAQRTLSSGLVTMGKAPVDAVTTGDNKIYISYNGNKNMVIEIPTATPDLPYEYCVVKKGDTFDITRVVWTSITKGTEVKILASKAVEGGTLYIRKKEIQSQEASAYSPAVDYALASTYVFHVINYPSIPEIVDASYTFTKGYSSSITFTATLNAVGKSPFETAIKNIKLGTKEIGFTASNSTAAGVTTMTITLRADSLATMTNCFARAITINYMNGTVDKTSIKLTIQSPTPAGSLTITSAKGTNSGTTSFTMVSSKGAGNSWVYVIGAAAITNVNTQDTVAGITSLTQNTFTATTVDNVTVPVNQYLTIFEVDATGHIVKFKCIQVTADIRTS